VQKGTSALPPIATAKADFPQTVMSALPLKADMCGALAHVCFGPEADIERTERKLLAQLVSCPDFLGLLFDLADPCINLVLGDRADRMINHDGLKIRNAKSSPG
jgi:hypothetical protein